MNHRVPQLNPGNTQFEIGHRKGVGRNARECVGMSMRMWISQGKRMIAHFLKKNQTVTNTRAKMTRLCVIPYNVKTHFGISDKIGAPNCDVLVIILESR